MLALPQSLPDNDRPSGHATTHLALTRTRPCAPLPPMPGLSTAGATWRRRRTCASPASPRCLTPRSRRRARLSVSGGAGIVLRQEQPLVLPAPPPLLRRSWVLYLGPEHGRPPSHQPSPPYTCQPQFTHTPPETSPTPSGRASSAAAPSTRRARRSGPSACGRCGRTPSRLARRAWGIRPRVVLVSGKGTAAARQALSCQCRRPPARRLDLLGWDAAGVSAPPA
jgi:hypothetical protein